MENIKYMYHSCTINLLTAIENSSIQVSCKMENRINKLWYDKECKIARRDITKYSNKSLNVHKINRYKSIIKIQKDNIYKHTSKETFTPLYTSLG